MSDERDRLLRETMQGDTEAAMKLIRDAIREKNFHQTLHAVSAGIQDLSARLEVFHQMARQLSNAMEQTDTTEALETGELFVVRHFDGMDYVWSDASAPMSHEEAQAKWNELTKGGTKNASFADIDYYKVFPQNTTMLHTRDRT